MIMLMEAGDSKGDLAKRKVLAIVGLALLAFFFSLILSIFRWLSKPVLEYSVGAAQIKKFFWWTRHYFTFLPT